MKKLLLLCLWPTLLLAQKKSTSPKKEPDPAAKEILNSDLLNALNFRSIGPAVTSGRIVDIVVNPANKSEWYIVSAAGGVWKTRNAGTTFDPVWESEGSYSTGCITMDPNNPNVLWLGSGENNNQRSVSYGDGLYKSEDGGKSWKNVGLKTSEHIGMIAVNPSNSNEVYVAAYGPVWSSGGERGLYKTTDGGKTWKQVLKISEHTGCNEVHIDPRYPNIVYATAHQRQRKVWTYIGGGPESAIYRSTNGGETFEKIMTGMPGGDIGRIGMDISPVNPDVLFAIVESRDGGGVYKSTDRGSSWEKQSSYTTSGNYYQEIVCDPVNINRLYVPDVFFQHSLDGGKNFSALGERNKHVDNHAIWTDPANTNHKLVGCDGGLYETYDDAATWKFFENLPVTQFYRVGLDNAKPFYNVYGGTQDNFSLGGPSRTLSGNGIANSDWFVTNGGDGFESVVDTEDPNIVYAESQYGGLVRYDKRSGEILSIQPQELAGEKANRWNWDAPLIISKHNHKRLYFGSQKVFRSDDQGGTWTVISPDLSSGIDRNTLPIMGKLWSVDAVAKNQSTDIYGQITSISESPLDENILAAATDDGLIHITTDGGKNWKKIAAPAGVPARTYAYWVTASLHDKNTFYALYNNHRDGDFKPYFYRSTDGGSTWHSIAGNLPERGSMFCMAEDPKEKNLLFCGTEFGVYASIDKGAKWLQLKGGLPTIAVRDMEIQARETDLVIATFGRGFYVLDNYGPLRQLAADKSSLEKPAFIFPVKDAPMYVESLPLGLAGKGFLGESHFATPNPKPGAVFTYHLKESIKTLREKRKEAEKDLAKKNQSIPYPSIDSLRLEDTQPAPYLLFTISDANGNVVRKLKAGASKGMKRLQWDMRFAPVNPVSLVPFDDSNPFASPDQGYMVVPGTYNVAMSKFENGEITPLAGPVSFNLFPLNQATLGATDKKALDAFCQKTASLQRAVNGANSYFGEMGNKVKHIKQALIEAPKASPALAQKLADIDKRMTAWNTAMNGDRTRSSREFETLPGISGRINNIAYALWSTTAGTTGTMQQQYDISAAGFEKLLAELKSIDAALKQVEKELEAAGAPYTPGRFPDWKNN